MKNIEKYIKKAKPGDKIDIIVTSVSLDLKQKEFLDLHNLNLSEMVRDMIDDFIKNFKGTKNENKKTS